MVELFPKNEIKAICTCVALSLGYYCLWEHQKDVVTNVVAGNNVFAILLAGYSKSLCYTCVYLAHLISFCHYEFKNCEEFPTHLARFASD